MVSSKKRAEEVAEFVKGLVIEILPDDSYLICIKIEDKTYLLQYNSLLIFYWKALVPSLGK